MPKKPKKATAESKEAKQTRKATVVFAFNPDEIPPAAQVSLLKRLADLLHDAGCRITSIRSFDATIDPRR